MISGKARFSVLRMSGCRHALLLFLVRGGDRI